MTHRLALSEDPAPFGHTPEVKPAQRERHAPFHGHAGVEKEKGEGEEDDKRGGKRRGRKTVSAYQERGQSSEDLTNAAFKSQRKVGDTRCQL